MKHQKKVRSEKIKTKRGAYTRERAKRNSILRTEARSKFRSGKFNSQAEAVQMKKLGLRARIYLFIKKAKIIFCKLGFHVWVEHSGLPGTAKYYCSRCTGFSKELWQERKHVENKFAPGVGKPIVWETHSGKRYEGMLKKLDGKEATILLKDGTTKVIDLP